MIFKMTYPLGWQEKEECQPIIMMVDSTGYDVPEMPDGRQGSRFETLKNQKAENTYGVMI